MTPIRPSMPSPGAIASSSTQTAQAPQPGPSNPPQAAAGGPQRRDNGNRPETLAPRTETPGTPMSVGQLVRSAATVALGAGGTALVGVGLRGVMQEGDPNSHLPGAMLVGGVAAMAVAAVALVHGRSGETAPAGDIEMGVATGPEARRAAVGEAMNIALGMGDVDMSVQIGPHGQRIVDHLHDLHQHRPRTGVRNAIDRANNDPQAIVTNLLGLINQTPPIVSFRPTSTMPSAT